MIGRSHNCLFVMLCASYIYCVVKSVFYIKSKAICMNLYRWPYNILLYKLN